MQFTLTALIKLSVFAVVANTAAVVALPEPVGLEARQTCLLQDCTPSDTNGCCAGASCTGVEGLLGLSLPGLCLPSACQVICTTTADCCTNVLNTTFTCELLPGQSIGGCIPQAV